MQLLLVEERYVRKTSCENTQSSHHAILLLSSNPRCYIMTFLRALLYRVERYHVQTKLLNTKGNPCTLHSQTPAPALHADAHVHSPVEQHRFSPLEQNVSLQSVLRCPPSILKSCQLERHKTLTIWNLNKTICLLIEAMSLFCLALSAFRMCECMSVWLTITATRLCQLSCNLEWTYLVLTYVSGFLFLSRLKW